MKKIIFSLIVVIMCFVLTGCNEKAVEGNKDFGKYTGIYKLNNVEFKIVHYKNTLQIQEYKDNELYGNTTVFTENNKFEDLDCKFEFKNNALKVTTKKKEIPSGDYIRVKPYSTEEIYKDYVGEESLLDNKYNGVYETKENTIYIIQIHDDTIRLAIDNNGVATNLELTKEDENHFSLDFFENKYDITFNNDTVDLKYESEDEDTISGKYTRKSKISAKDAVKIFTFDDFREE